MNCPKCRAPIDGFGTGCIACGHSGGDLRRALLWTLVPTGVIAATLGASIAIAEAHRTGSSRNRYSNAIEERDAPGRTQSFAKLMHDAGEVCTSTKRSLFWGDIGTNAVWAIGCGDTGDWMILIADNGATRVAQCGPLEKAGTPCWTPLDS